MMITFNTVPGKNATTAVTLDKQQLLQLSQIDADEFWRVAANISRVIFCYESSIGKQQKNVDFDFKQSSPSSVISFSAKARNLFLLDKIILRDFDEGRFSIKRSQLPISILEQLDVEL